MLFKIKFILLNTTSNWIFQFNFSMFNYVWMVRSFKTEVPFTHVDGNRMSRQSETSSLLTSLRASILAFFALVSPRTRKSNNHELHGWQLKSLSGTFIISAQDQNSSWTQHTSVGKKKTKKDFRFGFVAMKRHFDLHKVSHWRAQSGSNQEAPIRVDWVQPLWLLSAKHRVFQVIFTRPTRNQILHRSLLQHLALLGTGESVDQQCQVRKRHFKGLQCKYCVKMLGLHLPVVYKWQLTTANTTTKTNCILVTVLYMAAKGATHTPSLQKGHGENNPRV